MQQLSPTVTCIVLNLSRRTEHHRYDAQLESLTVRSRDGFAFDLEVAQIIHVGALDGPKVISRVGSMQIWLKFSKKWFNQNKVCK